MLVVADYFSRYYEIEIMRSTTSEIIERLEKIFTTHGLPLSVASDNGPQFRSDVSERYLQDCVIEYSKTTPLWPQANEEVERQNRSLLKRMRISEGEQGEGKE